MDKDIDNARKSVNALNKDSAEKAMLNKDIIENYALIENTAKVMFYIAEKIGANNDVLFHISQIIKLTKI